ncbi:LamB/YcsF family protein [Virgibacillus sp. NKC19-3]|uniref:LamB/YcsF family protein n=1 Tax=Virgibacillus saliphilus TaxID=2831674 RepID=UPI001C9B11DB|nr:5-oxoprolinase subunit PxpA [Virgibacillus sp. NKC19-3]MBY7144142.1 LamB/YcsF family protein [Virgibacillus sp. NKC19-3]
MRIDLNSDMGESFGAYTIGADEGLLKHITSANIACGSHAGDPHVMDKTVALAKKYHVAVGAHPGFPDIAGFGRRMIDFSPDEIYRLVVFQIGALQAICKIHNVSMQHVKPHGALYNLASYNREVAVAIARAVYDLDSNLILYGLAGSELLVAGRNKGLRVAAEVFADRTYQPDGSLTSRRQADAVIEDVDVAVQQVERIIREGLVKAANEELVQIEADTICVHGDGTNAVCFVEKLRKALEEAGVEVARIRK